MGDAIVELNQEVGDGDHVELDPGSSEMQERLFRLLHYSQVGECVNGVAHDINNLLGAILAYAELIQFDVKADSDISGMLEDILKAVGRCSDLVSTLTSVARPDSDRKTMVIVDALLSSLATMRAYDFTLNHVQVEKKVNLLSGTLMVDYPKLMRALNALVTNALEALASKETERHLLFGAETEDEMVIFRVHHNGAPLPEQMRHRLGEPLLTSKGGHHLGLGLAFVRSVAELHGGSLCYDPERGFELSIAITPLP